LIFLTEEEDHRLSLFENRAPRGIFGPNREEMAGGWRRLFNKELNNSYASPNIIRVNKSRRVRGAGGLTRVGKVRSA
jgi:hypothetical protein